MKPPPHRRLVALLGAVCIVMLTACQVADAPPTAEVLAPTLAKAPPTVAVQLPSDYRAAPSGLVAWWRGDGDATDVTGDHDGLPWGDATFGPGLVGQSFVLGGGSGGEVVIPFHPVFNLHALTTAAWVTPTGLDGDIDMIVNKEYRGPLGFFIQYEMGVRGSHTPEVGTIPWGNFAFYVRAAGLPSAHRGWADGYAPVPLHTWTHVAMTFDGTTVRAIVNGAVTRTVTGLVDLGIDNEGPFKIGSRSDDIVSVQPWERWQGAIDDVMLFDRALEPVEVRLIYLRGLVGARVTDGTLSSGHGNALLAKVASAQAKIEQGNLKSAANILGAFVNQLEALERSGTLPPSVAAALREVAAAGIGDLG